MRSRLSAPILPRAIVRRRLVERLARARARDRPSWIFAPAGAGKTTLVASFTSSVDDPSLWYQLDDTDAEAAAFFQHLAEAADALVPGIAAELPRLTPDYLGGLSAFTRLYCETMFGRLPSPCILVFDNVQELGAGSPIHGVLSQLLTNALAGQAFVFASREPPPAQLARRRVNRDLDVLDWEDLRFTPAECEEMLELMGLRDAERIGQITRASGGWAAGLVLMRGGGKPLSEAREARTNHQLAFDYFAKEAMRDVWEHDRALLFQAALFDAFTARMLSDLSGRETAAIELVLEDLHARQFFIERHAGEAPHYQFHPLFRRYLLTECEHGRAGRPAAALRRLAAPIALAEGHVDSAARLMIDAEDWPGLAALCREHAEALLHAGRHKELLNWIEKLPRALAEEEPWIRLWHGCAQLPYAPAAAAETFEHAYRAFKVREDIAGRYLAWACGVEALSYVWGNFEAAPFWIDELEEMLAVQGHPSLDVECRILSSQLLVLIWAEGGTARFPDLIERCYSVLHRVRDPSLKAGLAGALLYFHSAVSADVTAAADLVDAVHAEIVDGNALPSVKIFWYSNVSEHCANSGRTELAERVLDEARRLIDEFGLHVLRIVVPAHLAVCCTLRHDGEAADALIEQTRLRVVPERRIERLLYLFALAGRRFQQGDPLATRTALEEAYKLSVDTAARHPRALFANMLCYNALELGQAQRAREYHAVLRRIADRSGNTAYRYKLRLLDAALAQHEGDDAELRRALERALELGRETGICGVPGLVQPMVRLYALALDHGIEVEYVRRVIQTLGLKAEGIEDVPAAWPWPVQITTLGRFAIETNGQSRAVSSRQRRVTALLTLLIARHDKPLGKTQIKDLMWPETEPLRAEQNLKSTIVRLRKLLGEDVVEWRDTAVRLDRKQVWVDCWEVERLLDRSTPAGPGQGLELYEALSRLYGGRAQGIDESPWMLAFSERLHRKTCDAFVKGARVFLDADDLQAARSVSAMGLDVDDTLEPLYQVQIEAHMRAGEVAQAKRAYRTCMDVLSRKLRTLPSPATKALVAKSP